MKPFVLLIKLCAFLAMAGLSAVLHAQELPAQIQPLADKYKSDLAILESQRAGAVGRAQQTYIAALTAAENAALTASQLPVIAAITAESQAVTSNSMPAEFPRGLPATLQPARKVYMDTVARIAAEMPPRKEKIGVDYLRALTGLQASADAELSAAIAGEKLRILSEAKAAALPPARAVVTGPAARTLPQTVPAAPAGKLSMLEKVAGFPWDAGREKMIGVMKSRPGAKRGDDWEGIPIFYGGELHGQPIDTAGLRFFGEKLTKVDFKLQAPGDSKVHYESLLKKLTSLLGPGSVGRESGHREATWRSQTGGSSGKGEVVTLKDKGGVKDRIFLDIFDPGVK